MRKPKRTKVKKEDSNIEIVQEADDTICSECHAEFLDPTDLEVHMQQMHSPGSPGELVPCQFCVQAFPNAEVYVLHIRDVHLVDLRHCSYCSRVYRDLHHLRKHERKHVDAICQNKYSCFQCGLDFENNYSLRHHDATHQCMDGGVFLNEYYALLSSVINMKADSVIQATGKDFIYVCSCCKYSNPDIHDYIAHLKAKNCRTLACNKCYKVFTRRDLVRDHIFRTPECKSLTLLPPIKKCSKCNKNVDLVDFKAHFKSCTVLKCPSCSLLFENMYELSEHQSAEHPLSVALISCKFCRKECVGKVSLEKHIERAHKHEFHLYKYTCTYCDTSFKHPQRLFAHYFMKHKDIEPYHCKICDKKYRLRKPFTLHIKLAHNSKGFVEFDERLHVFFAEQRSEKPFQPVSKYASEPVANKTIKSKVASTKEDQGKETDNNKDGTQMVNVNSDFMNPTETEGNQTDAIESGRIKRKRKTKLKSEIETIVLSEDYDSEDEPLVVIKKKAKIKSQLRKRGLRMSRKCKNWKHDIKQRFTCEICKKYCYTFQNYNNHLSMHFKDESKKCIKCSHSFKTKADLQKHLEEKHSSSKLTETLKQLLERRKNGEQKKELTTTEKFLRTVKKVVFDNDNVTATLSPVSSELSVQKFIENFTPEANEAKNVQVKNTISCTKVMARFREPVIKMNKFQPAPKVYGNIKLSMPVRFKSQSHEKHTVTIKKVEPRYDSNIKFQFDDGNQFQDDYDNDYKFNDQEDNRDGHIPEAEHEVTLEGTEEPPPPKKLITHKIVLPKLEKQLKSIRIAHLLPEAPYYKIVKMDDIIKKEPPKKEPPKVEYTPSQPVQLPDGTKLVHVNPLAHLLGDTPIESLIKPHSKYYKPKALNLQDALAKALLKTPNRKPRKRPAKAKNVQAKEATEVKSEEINKMVAELESSLPCVDGDGNGNESLPCVEEQVVYENKSLPCLDDTNIAVV
ncbi:uncharacterized protein [Choristoneura fumiferana]|uniref:uncharacterized protein n=1 Tax=Choristoneura fumiferana TaxID=7141 RepID=UPI003D15D369